jgi:hypothetical protein
VKTPIGRLSPDQAEFGRRTIGAGAEYYLVRSIDDVQRLGF